MAEAFAIVTYKFPKKREKKIYLYERNDPSDYILNSIIEYIEKAILNKKNKKKKIDPSYLYLILTELDNWYIYYSESYYKLHDIYDRYVEKKKMPNFDIKIKRL